MCSILFLTCYKGFTQNFCFLFFLFPSCPLSDSLSFKSQRRSEIRLGELFQHASVGACAACLPRGAPRLQRRVHNVRPAPAINTAPLLRLPSVTPGRAAGPGQTFRSVLSGLVFGEGQIFYRYLVKGYIFPQC